MGMKCRLKRVAVHCASIPRPSAFPCGTTAMFSVESLIHEDALSDTMQTMRTWLDHKRFEPITFRYSFTSAGIVCRVDFDIEGEAAVFATAFDGTVVTAV